MGILGISYALVLDRETSNIQLKLNHKSHQSFSYAERYNLITFKGVYHYIFSFKTGQNQACELTDTFPPCPSEKTPFTLLTCPETTSSKLRRTKHAEKRGRSKKNGMRDWEKKRSRGRGEIVFLGSKAILLPSTLVHSLHATLASGGMGADCHWCHSPVNQSVTGSDGLHVAERKPPAKRHMGWSHHLFMLAIKPPLPEHSSSLAHWPYFTFWFWGNYSLLSWLSV